MKGGDTLKLDRVHGHCDHVMAVVSDNYLSDLSCIWLISNEAQMQYDTTVGCNLEAQMKGGGIQKLDCVHWPWHCEGVTPAIQT